MDENAAWECKLTTSCRRKLQRCLSSKIESARCEKADPLWAYSQRGLAHLRTSAEAFCGKWSRLNKCRLACKIIHGQHIKAKHRAVKSANRVCVFASTGDLIKRLVIHEKCITFRVQLRLWCRCFIQRFIIQMATRSENFFHTLSGCVFLQNWAAGLIFTRHTK